MCQELQIFYICECVFGCKLSLVRLCDSDFGFTPVDNITIAITFAAFCFHIAQSLFASSWYLFCLSVIVLGEIVCIRDSYVYQKMFFVFLFIKIMLGSVKKYCLSVCVQQFQYSLKFLFCSTLAIIIIIIIRLVPSMQMVFRLTL